MAGSAPVGLSPFQVEADLAVLASMRRTLARFADDDIPVPVDEVPALRAFFAAWAAEL